MPDVQLASRAARELRKLDPARAIDHRGRALDVRAPPQRRDAAATLTDVTVHDLYDVYPQFHIDVDSDYRHELEGDIEPFKGLLLGRFFISIGAQLDA